MKKRKMKDDEGCAGGRTESIRLYKQQEKYFDAYVYHCADESGDLYLMAGTSSLFTSLIPEGVEKLIKTTKRLVDNADGHLLHLLHQNINFAKTQTF